MPDTGVFVVETWSKGGVSHLRQSIVGIEKTKRIRGIGIKCGKAVGFQTLHT